MHLVRAQVGGVVNVPSGLILLYATRYALGRQTWAPSDVSSAIRGARDLDARWGEQIADEVVRWLAEDFHDHPEADVWRGLVVHLDTLKWAAS